MRLREATPLDQALKRLLYCLYAVFLAGFAYAVFGSFPSTAPLYHALGLPRPEGPSMDRFFWTLFALIPGIWLVQGIVNVRRGSLFPAVPPDQIRFRENWASGRSYQRWWHRVGGVNNGLRVTVTCDELWTQLSPPLSVIAPGRELGLENRIPLDRITGVQKRGFINRHVLISFLDADQQPQQLLLGLRKRDMFLRTMAASGVPIG